LEEAFAFDDSPEANQLDSPVIRTSTIFLTAIDDNVSKDMLETDACAYQFEILHTAHCYSIVSRHLKTLRKVKKLDN
jgi:hypothetical protein